MNLLRIGVYEFIPKLMIYKKEYFWDWNDMTSLKLSGLPDRKKHTKSKV